MTYEQRCAYIEKLKDYRSVSRTSIQRHKELEHDLLEMIISAHFRDADFLNDCETINMYTSFRHPDLPYFN